MYLLLPGVLILLMLPADILTAVESGVDVFDGACVFAVSERGCAFTYQNSWASSPQSVDKRESSTTEHIARDFPSYQIDLNDIK